MDAAEIIVIIAIVLIIGGAVAYIVKAKMSGKRCIGCPDSATCHSNKSAGSACSGSCHSCSCGCGSAGNNADSTKDTGNIQENQTKDGK